MSDISNFVQRGTDTVLGWVLFHLFHTGLARNRTIFAMTQHFTKLGDTPFWHLCVPKGAEMTSLWGGVPFAPLPAGSRRHCLNTTNYYAS